jgi:hypothetical protein
MDELEKLIKALLDATDMTEEQATALYERLDALSPQEWANDEEVRQWSEKVSSTTAIPSTTTPAPQEPATSVTDPPAKFLEWLQAKYGPVYRMKWALANGRNRNWQNDPSYQYWRNVERVPPPINYATEDLSTVAPEELLNNVFTRAKTPQQLGKALQAWYEKEASAPGLSKEDIANLYVQKEALLELYLPRVIETLKASLPQGAWETVGQFSNKEDLASRIESLGIDQETQADLYDTMIGVTSPATLELRQAAQRRQGRAGDLSEALSAVSNAQATPGTYQRRADLINAPEVTPDQAWKDTFEQNKRLGEQYLGGKNDDIMTVLKSINQNAEARNAAEGLRARQLMGVARQPRTRLASGMPVAGMPDAYDTVQPYLDTSLPEGSKLRQFLESGIESAYRETQPEREKWLQRQNTWSGGASYEDEKARIGGERDRWNAIAESAPSSRIAGDVYYGEGGLKAIAEEASQESLSGLEPYQTTRSRIFTQTEDPLVVAARKKRENLMPDYNRQIGAGTVPRLQRGLRVR